MDKLKKVIGQYGRWSPLTTYTDRIEACVESDFSQALENVKALLESIGREICENKGISLEKTTSFQSVIRKSFSAIGYSGENYVTQISTALTNIAQQVGALRNDIGATSHGKTLDELKERNQKVDEITREFVIDSTVIVACFLIRTFENENPRVKIVPETKMLLSEQEDFNSFWDDTYGDFGMGDYSYTASEILYSVDYPAYETECNAFEESKEGK